MVVTTAPGPVLVLGGSVSQSMVVTTAPGPVLVLGGHGDAQLAGALHHVVYLVEHPVHRQLVRLCVNTKSVY